ncbi:MAG TPA: hypothetical protein VM055_06335 [Novosphingobium sp.]|nr:hypothetical protein [Novosphingobium sp.]
MTHLIAQKPSRPYFFDIQSAYQTDLVSVNEFLASEEGREFDVPKYKVDNELARKQERIASQSPFLSCAEIKAILDESKIPYGLSSERGLPPQRADGTYFWTYIGISMPAISDDGRFALLEDSSVVAPLGGGGQSIRLERRRDGTWQIKEILPTWIA